MMPVGVAQYQKNTSTAVKADLVKIYSYYTYIYTDGEI